MGCAQASVFVIKRFLFVRLRDSLPDTQTAKWHVFMLASYPRVAPPPPECAASPPWGSTCACSATNSTSAKTVGPDQSTQKRMQRGQQASMQASRSIGQFSYNIRSRCSIRTNLFHFTIWIPRKQCLNWWLSCWFLMRSRIRTQAGGVTSGQ